MTDTTATRVIHVEDQASATTTKIVISQPANGPAAIDSITICGYDGGIPEEIVNALLPYIGLPAVPAGRLNIPAPRRPQPPTSSDRSGDTYPTFAPPSTNEHKGAVMVLPARVGVAAEKPAPAPAEPAPAPGDDTAAANGRDRLAKRPYRVAPPDSELAAVIKRLGTDSPAAIARELDVPAYTVTNWLRNYKRRNRA